MSKKSKSKRQQKRKSVPQRSTHSSPPKHPSFPAPQVALPKPTNVLSWQDKLVRVLSMLGVLLTAYLSLVAMQGSEIAFCTDGSGCDIVQQSKWSRFLGLPLALWGLGFYMVLLGTSFSSLPKFKRWKRLWRLSFIGLVISIYLTTISFVTLHTFCLWCLASFAFVASIFSLVHLNKPHQVLGNKAVSWYATNTVLALTVVLAMFVSASNILSMRGDPRLHQLATHLQETDAKFYGAYWCPACLEQKKKFSGAQSKLPYIECSPNGPQGSMSQQCVRAGVSSYPTWVINGRMHTGVTEPRALADMSGFKWEEKTQEE